MTPGTVRSNDAKETTPLDLKNQVRHILRHAAAIIVGGGWCRNTWAKDAEGCEISATHASAAAWCGAGAVNRAMHDLGYNKRADAHDIERGVTDAVKRAEPTYFTGCGATLVGYNDAAGRSEAQMVHLFIRAAELA